MAKAHTLDFRAWFGEYFLKDGIPLREEDMASLARECFSSYQSSRFDVIKCFLYQGQRHVEEVERFDELLREMGTPIKMTQLLHDSATALVEDLKTGVMVEGTPPSPPLRIPLLKRKLDPEGILHRMFSQADREEQLRQNLYQIASMNELPRQLHRYAETIFTQVHPELLIINYFDMLGSSDFFDNSDKYIACSRASCYLCCQYTSSHPKRYTVEPASKEIDLHWRLPDISIHESRAAPRFNQQKLVLQKLTDHVRKYLESLITSHCISNHSYAEQPIDDIDSQSIMKDDADSTTNCDHWSLNSDMHHSLADHGLSETRST